jgi:hypothetical protein
MITPKYNAKTPAGRAVQPAGRRAPGIDPLAAWFELAKPAKVALAKAKPTKARGKR